MEENIRVRYSDKELEEFKAIIEEKIKKAQTDLELIRSSYMNSATNGTAVPHYSLPFAGYRTFCNAFSQKAFLPKGQALPPR